MSASQQAGATNPLPSARQTAPLGAEPAPGPRIYVATESFACEINGRTETVMKDRTRVSEDHPIFKANPQYFTPVDAHYRVEQMTAEPGQRRGAPS